MSVNTERIAREIGERIRKVVASNQDLYLHEPYLGKDEIKLVTRSIKDGWVSSAGPQIKEFELKLAKFMGAKYAICVSSGTSALELSLRACGVKPNTEVVIPSLTFCATANAVAQIGAIPNFVDVNPTTFGLDPSKLEIYLNKITIWRDGKLINKNTENEISAIMPVHIFGHPVQFDEILLVAKKFNLVVIEDAAEALGSIYRGKKCGTLGTSAAISFNGNKIITTGGGGAVITNSTEVANNVRHLSTTAKISHPYEFYHDQVGYNYRMPNINAALGVAQIEKLNKILKLKRNLASNYFQIFKDFEYGLLASETRNCISNFWLNTIVLDTEKLDIRDKIIELLHNDGIYCRPIWTPLHLLPHFQCCPRSDLEITEKLRSKIINIPSSPKLTLEV
jgi:perosamine synthetase